MQLQSAYNRHAAQPMYNEYTSLSTSVCVLLVQGAPLMNKVGTFTEEGIIQQSSIYIHPLQCLQHKKHRHLTENDKMDNRCTLVTNVGSVIHFRAACVSI